MALACAAEIMPFNFRFISMGLVIQGPPSFLYACPKVILAPSLICLLLLVHRLRPPFPSHPAAVFLPHLTASPGPGSFYPSASQTADRLPEPSPPPPTPCAPCPRPWEGRSAVTEGDTLLWLPLVNVSITSSLRQRGEKSVQAMESTFLFHFILLYFKKVEGKVVLGLDFS